MPTRDSAPIGSPCWADLWTSDVEDSRRFYAELFGWEAQEPSPEFGGYFMFTRNGVPVAGAMGDMGDMGDLRANDAWKIYLATEDIAKTVETAVAAGAESTSPPHPVADLGVQTVLTDPTGAQLGAWQAGTFPGFTVLNEHGAPSWFELHTQDYAGAVTFYRSVFGWDTDVVSDTDQLRYTVMRDPDRDAQLAGIMDVSSFVPAGQPSSWTVYWEVDDPGATLSSITALGGSVVAEAQDTPHGRIATAKDPSGAEFRIRRSAR